MRCVSAIICCNDSNEGVFRLSYEAGLGDCTAEARPSTELRMRGYQDPLVVSLSNHANSVCLCGEFFFTENPEQPK
jgi:hypothetical protein